MKPSSWDKQVELASPRESAASQSDQTNNPSKDVVRNEVGLDVSHHTRISQRGGEMLFLLTSSLPRKYPFSWSKVNLGSCRFHRISVIEMFQQLSEG
jgi:hypothetical protein